MPQESFDGIKEHFSWTPDGWYKWDPKAAHKTALQNRKNRVKELKSQGREVFTFSLGKQLRILGGIGTDKPEIEIITSGLMLEYR